MTPITIYLTDEHIGRLAAEQIMTSQTFADLVAETSLEALQRRQQTREEMEHQSDGSAGVVPANQRGPSPSPDGGGF